MAALIGNTNDGGLKENAIAHFYGGTFIGGGDQTAVKVDYPIGGLEITGGTYSSDVTAYVPAGNSVTSDESGNFVVELDTKTAVVEIDGAGYTSMQAAVDAIAASHSKTGTITVQKDIPDAEGVSVPSGLKLTVDFADYTYTLSGPGAGSTNTETNGFQLLKDSEIVFKNGTIKIAENANNIKRMIQSYADVTLENMRFEAENQVGGEDYALSFNHGNVVFKGDTSVITSSSDTIAFDVCFWTPYYPDGVSVTFADDYTGTVNGKILYDSTDEEKAELVIGGNGSFGSIETSSSSTEQPNIKISGGSYETSPVAYTTGDTVVLRYNNGSYAVGGTAQTVAASAADNSTIEVMKGSAAFSIGADNVTVKNNGDGTVTVNQITVEQGMPMEVHALERVEAKSAGCTTEGNREYYKCSACGEIFADSQGKTASSLDEMTIPATGHSVSGDWASDGDKHWKECTGCGARLEEAAHTFRWVTDKEATTSEKGIRHEECEICGYKKADVEIPATGSSGSSGSSSGSGGSGSHTSNIGATTPQTGDNHNIFGWIVLILASGAGLAGVVVYNKKRKCGE